MGVIWKQLFGRKSLEVLHKEMQDDNRLRRVLGPMSLTSLGVGAIIGAGIFVMTGRAASLEAGPAIMISYLIAGLGCLFAALCYAEFASTAPVAGSAYTYAYATLGELFAWIIGWDLILEYAMSCATVAASWSKYLNEFLRICFGEAYVVPDYLCHDPFSHPGALFNLPAVLILALVTVILVIGIRESAASNNTLVVVKVGVVLFVIFVGVWYINPANWTSIPEWERHQPEETVMLSAAHTIANQHIENSEEADRYSHELSEMAGAQYRMDLVRRVGDAEQIAAYEKKYGPKLPATEEQKSRVAAVLAEADKLAPNELTRKWGLFGLIGLDRMLGAIDDQGRTRFTPYGISGIMLGAAIVFFAFIGFDSISTHSEEAIRPQRDVPIGIMGSLAICAILYVLVAGVITGIEPYPEIDPDAAVASAFRKRAEASGSSLLHASAGLIATGALAGMTSVLLITFLSQARIFLAMARDGLLPKGVFGSVHETFRTPHISTMFTGGLMCLVAGVTPIEILEEMVSIGTLFAFVVVCSAVLLLRLQRPDVHRPFRTPLVWLVAPMGVLVNVGMMLFLPWETWLRLVIWLGIGLVIYFAYSMHNSYLRHALRNQGGA